MTSKVKLELTSDEKLETAARAVSAIAHDYNNALASIGAYTALLLDSCDSVPGAAADLEGINSAADKAACLNRKLLSFSRRKPPEKQEMDIGLFLKKILPEIKKTAAPVPLKLEAAATGKSEINAEQLKELVLILTLNAAEAVKLPGGKIKISAKKKGSVTEIKISDNGSGITKENAERLFEPFFTTKHKKEGLGLAMVYGIGRRHSAGIKVESEPGKGSEFSILLGMSEPGERI